MTTSEERQKLQRFIDMNSEVMLVRVTGGVPELLIDKQGFQTRHASIFELIQILYSERYPYKDTYDPPKDVVFLIYTGDSARQVRWVGGELKYLCQSKIVGVANAIALPDFSFHHWPETRMPAFRAFYEDMKGVPVTEGTFAAKHEQMFWIGVCTHRDRTHFVERFGNGQKKDFLVKVFSWDHPARTGYVSIPDHGAYKYLIDIRGSGWSARVKYLLLLGSVVFIVDRPDKDCWMDQFEPWVHYVPVREDMSDLEEVFAKVVGDSVLAFRIAQEGQRRAFQVFSEHNVMAMLHRAICDVSR